MGKLRPIVLSIAGIDPSAGAGLMADLKTFEANQVYGLGIPSAITCQHDLTFKHVEWTSLPKIMEQVELLKERFKITFIKIGLIENLGVLDQLLTYLLVELPHAKIIWDPIIKASVGHTFHSEMEWKQIVSICQKIYLLTPNIPEAIQLGESDCATENAKTLGTLCHVYLKGGHAEKEKGKDFLFTKEGKKISFNTKTQDAYSKHGSGCVLSAAITSYLAREVKLHGACLKAKSYTFRFLNSNTTLLGYHKR